MKQRLDHWAGHMVDVVEDTAEQYLNPLRGLASLVAGGLFGYGLGLSSMLQPQEVMHFLRFNNLGLVVVLGSAVLMVLPFLVLAPKGLRTPLLGGSFERHSAVLDGRTLLGSAIFGIGWGMSGLCPGPAIAGLGATNWEALWVLGGLFLGALLHGLLGNWAMRRG